MLFFMRSRLLGSVLLIMTLLQPNLALSGLFAWLATITFARLIGIRRDDIAYTVYTYNALLVGFSIGFLFKISLLSLLLIAGTSVLTVMLSYALVHAMGTFFKLPVLNIPFFVVSTIVYLASSNYSTLLVDAFYPSEKLNLNWLPGALQGLFRATGIIMFMPYDLAGLFMLTALLLYSRIAFIMAVCAYYLGIMNLSLLKGDMAEAYRNLSAFNFILIGIALGGVFLIASRRSYALALIGVFSSVFILDAVSAIWMTFGVPVFTLPFNLMVLLFIYVLSLRGYPEINLCVRTSPEKSLAAYLNHVRRFDHVTPRPFLPFSGRWTVYQAFDDQWTHQGPWKYAYDFVIRDAQGNVCRAGGGTPQDYYCFGKPVLSPVGGTVVDAGDMLPDNSIGVVDHQNNWGNYAVIYSPFGYYIEISHLQHQSLRIKIGDTVQIGTLLGNCGNSGNSPQPHIHMQVQYTPGIGHPTWPFFLGNCMNRRNRLIENEHLDRGAEIEPVSFSKKLMRILTFVPDDTFTFMATLNGRPAGQLAVRVRMAPSGSYFIEHTGRGDRLYYGIENNRFVFYSFDGDPRSHLACLFAAAPRIPLAEVSDLNWQDRLPDDLLFPGGGRHMLLKSLNHNAAACIGRYRWSGAGTVEGTITGRDRHIRTRAVLDNVKGFREVTVESPKCTVTLTMEGT